MSFKLFICSIENLTFLADRHILFHSTRTALGTTTKEDYWNAYKAVVEEVRKRLENPRMNLTVEEIDITYFEAI